MHASAQGDRGEKIASDKIGQRSGKTVRKERTVETGAKKDPRETKPGQKQQQQSGACKENEKIDGKSVRTGAKKDPRATKPGQKEPGQKEPGQKEPGQKEPGQKGPGQKEPGQKEPGQNGPGQKEPGQKEPGQNEPGQKGPGQKQPGSAKENDKINAMLGIVDMIRASEDSEPNLRTADELLSDEVSLHDIISDNSHFPTVEICDFLKLKCQKELEKGDEKSAAFTLLHSQAHGFRHQVINFNEGIY